MVAPVGRTKNTFQADLRAKAADDGQHWVAIHQTLPIVPLTALVPANGLTEDVVYAATSAKGLFVLRGAISFDGGFDDVDAGLEADGGSEFDGGLDGGETVVGECGCSTGGSLLAGLMWLSVALLRKRR